MKATPKNIVRLELIGREAQVVRSTDKNKVGIRGRIVDETKNMIKILTERGEKKIPKAECTFRIKLDDVYVDIDGKILVARPEERIKKRYRK